jgi:NitT/TauT family transport system substrate-binding protein
MLFKRNDLFSGINHLGLKIGLLALVWMILISSLHIWLNSERDPRKIIRMGYMPVITNLSAPILDYITKPGSDTYFQAVKFASFAEMAEALRNGQIQAAFMIAPLSIVLAQQGEDVRVVYIGNRNESTLVARKELGIHKIEDLSDRTIAVPMRFSGHNIALLKLIDEGKLDRNVRIVEMNPPDMASALSGGALDAYFVGEPFAAQALKHNTATLVSYVEEIWKNFICNLVIVHQSLIDQDPDVVQALVSGAVGAGIWARKNTTQAAEIAAAYWKQKEDLVKYALTTPKNRINYSNYIPREEELQHMANLMKKFGLIKRSDIGELVQDRFARKCNPENIFDLEDLLKIIRTAER